MPDFEFTSPEGKKYTVTGPEGATPEQAFQMLQTQLGAPPPAAPPRPTQGGRQGIQPSPAPNYGLREDGTPKGAGFFGELKRPDGKISTELSVGVELDGKEVQMPTLVPTLSKQEVDYLLKGGKPTPAIVQKAAAFAQDRIRQGKSPFADAGEQQAPPRAPGQGGRQGVQGVPEFDRMLGVAGRSLVGQAGEVLSTGYNNLLTATGKPNLSPEMLGNKVSNMLGLPTAQTNEEQLVSDLAPAAGVLPFGAGMAGRAGAAGLRAAAPLAERAVQGVGNAAGAVGRAVASPVNRLAGATSRGVSTTLGRPANAAGEALRGTLTGELEHGARTTAGEAQSLKAEADQYTEAARNATTVKDRITAQSQAADARSRQHLATLAPKAATDEEVGAVVQKHAQDRIKALRDEREKLAIDAAKTPAWQRTLAREAAGDLPSKFAPSATKLQEAQAVLDKLLTDTLPGLRPSKVEQARLRGMFKGDVTLEQLEGARRTFRDPMAREGVEGLKAMKAVNAAKVADKIEEAMVAYDKDVATYLKEYRKGSDKIEAATGGPRGEAALKADTRPQVTARAYLDGTRASARQLIELSGGKTRELTAAVRGNVRAKLEAMTPKQAQTWLSKNTGMLDEFGLSKEVKSFVQAKNEAERLSGMVTPAGKAAEANRAAAATSTKGATKASDASKMVADAASSLDGVPPEKVVERANTIVRDLLSKNVITPVRAQELRAQIADAERKYGSTATAHKWIKRIVGGGVVLETGHLTGVLP